MATLNFPAVGGDDGIWGAKVNAALAALNAELVATTSTATGAATPAQVTSSSTAARDQAVAASEPRLGRTNASATTVLHGDFTWKAPVGGTGGTTGGSVQTRRYINGAWQVRGTTDANVTIIWIKANATDPNPPSNATYFLNGTDLLLMAAA